MSLPTDVREALSLQYAMQKARRTTAYCLAAGIMPDQGIPDVLEDFKNDRLFAHIVFELNRAMDIAHLIYIRNPNDETRASWLQLEGELGRVIHERYPLPRACHNITHEVPKDPFARDDVFVPVKRYEPFGPKPLERPRVDPAPEVPKAGPKAPGARAQAGAKAKGRAKGRKA